MRAKCLLLVGMGLATLADLGTGLLTASLLIKFFHKQQIVWCYPLSMFAAIAPDFDILFAKFLKKEDGAEHHNYGHYPMLIIPLGLLLFFLFDLFWTLLVCFPLFAHFIHDSTGGAVGRMWLWPFSKENYQLFITTEHGFVFARPYYRYQWNRVQSLPFKEWIGECYLTPNKKLLKEVGWFLFAVAVFFFV